MTDRGNSKKQRSHRRRFASAHQTSLLPSQWFLALHYENFRELVNQRFIMAFELAQAAGIRLAPGDGLALTPAHLVVWRTPDLAVRAAQERDQSIERSKFLVLALPENFVLANKKDRGRNADRCFLPGLIPFWVTRVHWLPGDRSREEIRGDLLGVEAITREEFEVVFQEAVTSQATGKDDVADAETRIPQKFSTSIGQPSTVRIVLGFRWALAYVGCYAEQLVEERVREAVAVDGSLLLRKDWLDLLVRYGKLEISHSDKATPTDAAEHPGVVLPKLRAVSNVAEVVLLAAGLGERELVRRARSQYPIVSSLLNYLLSFDRAEYLTRPFRDFVTWAEENQNRLSDEIASANKRGTLKARLQRLNVLLGYLKHGDKRIGQLLHFEDDPELRAFLLLERAWNDEKPEQMATLISGEKALLGQTEMELAWALYGFSRGATARVKGGMFSDRAVQQLSDYVASQLYAATSDDSVLIIPGMSDVGLNVSVRRLSEGVETTLVVGRELKLSRRLIDRDSELYERLKKPGALIRLSFDSYRTLTRMLHLSGAPIATRWLRFRTGRPATVSVASVNDTGWRVDVSFPIEGVRSDMSVRRRDNGLEIMVPLAWQHPAAIDYVEVPVADLLASKPWCDWPSEARKFLREHVWEN